LSRLKAKAEKKTTAKVESDHQAHEVVTSGEFNWQFINLFMNLVW
jgi:hypothetical protein